MAVIRIHDLRVSTIIGVHAHERKKKQELLINIMIEYDSSIASRTDDIKDALDYGPLPKRIIRTVNSSRYFLLEKLTAKILEDIMTDQRIKSASVRLDKPKAVLQAKCVSLEIGYGRQVGN